MELFVAFILGVSAFLIYSKADNTKFKECLDRYEVIKKQNVEQLKLITEAEGEIKTLRGLVNKYREDVEKVQEHLARIRKGQKTLQNQHLDLRDKQKVQKIYHYYDKTPFEPVSPGYKSPKELLKKVGNQVKEF